MVLILAAAEGTCPATLAPAAPDSPVDARRRGALGAGASCNVGPGSRLVREVFLGFWRSATVW